jgi:hypothetical protein
VDLQQLLGSIRQCWVALGQAVTPEAPSAVPGMSTGARVVMVQLAGSDRPPIECRVVHMGQGLTKGVFAPITSGDEVVVLFPMGDPNRAVVLGGLGNGVAVNPLANLSVALLLMHPAGVELRSADGLPAHGIVQGNFLTDLATYLTALEAFLFACSTATTAAQIATAAVTFMSTVQKVAAAPSTFLAQLTTAGAGDPATGQGTAPYASILNRVTS